VSKLIAVTGYKNSGKNAVCDVLRDTYGFEVTGMADALKERFPEIRRLLQKAGTEGGRDIFGQEIWPKTWYKSAKVLLEQGYDVCVSDLRFLNEAAFVRELGGEVWRVYRPGTDVGDKHKSETELDSITPDRVIQNNGSLADLHGLVVGAML
jgi:hypothetical protein